MQGTGSNDKVSFKQSIDTHIAHLQVDHGLTLMVSDSAGYSSASLKAYEQQGVHWVMSVPGTLTEVKEHLAEADPTTMNDLAEGYRYTPLRSYYAGVEQRWLLIYSEQARTRAVKSVDKELSKQSKQEHKAFEKLCPLRRALCRTRFNCPEDAERALVNYQKTLKVLAVYEPTITSHKHFASAGRPRKDAVPDAISYHVSGALAATISQRESLISKRSCFILATDNLDENDLSDADILTEYKGQAHVEHGFRFLKHPMFLASTLFLKKVERITCAPTGVWPY